MFVSVFTLCIWLWISVSYYSIMFLYLTIIIISIGIYHGFGLQFVVALSTTLHQGTVACTRIAEGPSNQASGATPNNRAWNSNLASSSKLQQQVAGPSSKLQVGFFWGLRGSGCTTAIGRADCTHALEELPAPKFAYLASSWRSCAPSWHGDATTSPKTAKKPTSCSHHLPR